MMEEFVTACPRNCYSTCTFRVQIENNRIIRILPYSGNLATPEGPCIKGLSYIERTHSTDRIIHPLIRKSHGGFEEISTNEALDIISDRLSSVKEKWGSQSIFWFRGSGMSGLTNEIGYSFWKPKFDVENKIIAKCNLCYSGLLEGHEPACSSGCPTGALRFGQISEPGFSRRFSWFPDKRIKPCIEFTSKVNDEPLKIVPENIFGQPAGSKNSKERKNNLDELSLIIFSFLSTLSVAAIISSFIKGEYPKKIIFIPVIVLAGLVSLFHLGKKLRSWRSVTNLRNSPLSREIAAFIVYAFVSVLAVFFRIPGFLIVASVTGLIFLMLIDSVYIYADKRRSVFLHSGQTFISSLIIVSFFSGIILPFVFIAIIKLAASIYRLSERKLKSTDFGIRFMRIAFLVVPGLNLILHASTTDIFIAIIFLTGELLDRIIFYFDFNPLNINTLIDKQLNIDRNEKKRG